MDNVGEKVFKIAYITAYVASGIFLLFHLIGWGFWSLVIAYAVITLVLFFLGYLIQEHLDHILQLFLIVLGLVTILALFFKTGFLPSISLLVLGVSLIGIAFIFDEFFDKGL